MKKYEVHVLINGGEVRIHDIEISEDEPKPATIINGLIKCYYRDEKTVLIKKAVEYREERCDQCSGDSIIRACCSGDPRNIDCYCHGEDQTCDCLNGVIRYYQLDYEIYNC
jgi:hypothetical protein